MRIRTSALRFFSTVLIVGISLAVVGYVLLVPDQYVCSHTFLCVREQWKAEVFIVGVFLGVVGVAACLFIVLLTVIRYPGRNAPQGRR